MCSHEPDPEHLLRFWFGDSPGSGELRVRENLWFGATPATDRLIAGRFGAWLDRALAGGLEAWRATPRGRLALIVLLDQFTRNIHRGSARAFAGDTLARAVARRALDDPLEPIEQVFVLLPFEHSEDIADQELAVARHEALVHEASPAERARFESFLRFARHHHELIDRFGRFPHRNAALGRLSTDAERAWLAAGGERFGQ